MKTTRLTFILFLTLSGCVTTQPEPEVEAPADERSHAQLLPSPFKVKPTQQVSLQSEEAMITCATIPGKVLPQNLITLGFVIDHLEIHEQQKQGELVIKRRSFVGALPLKDLRFPSYRYSVSLHGIYGEWDQSEHWLQVERDQEGKLSGHFIYEGEFNFPVVCVRQEAQ